MAEYFSGELDDRLAWFYIIMGKICSIASFQLKVHGLDRIRIIEPLAGVGHRAIVLSCFKVCRKGGGGVMSFGHLARIILHPQHGLKGTYRGNGS